MPATSTPCWRSSLTGADCELLIGRSRPIDRADLQTRVLDRFGTGRAPIERPAVLVATQTVEVGVNLDVDVLVTESASWDAIVQRLGRLNRLGEFADRFPGHAAAPAIVVHDGQADGPIYGPARDATWAALTDLATDAGIDAGITVSPLLCRALTERFTEHGLKITRRPGGVPVLLRPTLDAWAQTSPVPLNDPPVAPYLHGFDAGAAAVQVLWRDELVEPGEVGGFVDPFDDDPVDDGERAHRKIDALLTQWPPRSAEIVEIPFMAARRWIGGLAPDRSATWTAPPNRTRAPTGPASHSGSSPNVRRGWQRTRHSPGSGSRPTRYAPATASSYPPSGAAWTSTASPPPTPHPSSTSASPPPSPRPAPAARRHCDSTVGSPPGSASPTASPSPQPTPR